MAGLMKFRLAKPASIALALAILVKVIAVRVKSRLCDDM